MAFTFHKTERSPSPKYNLNIDEDIKGGGSNQLLNKLFERKLCRTTLFYRLFFEIQITCFFVNIIIIRIKLSKNSTKRVSLINKTISCFLHTPRQIKYSF